MIPTLDVAGALAALAAGDVVAVPTDTVYGLAAALSRPSAVAQLFTLKRRPATTALPVFVNSVHQIETLGVGWSPRARLLGEVFWPGALTIIVPAPAALAERLGSTGGTVGFRCPDDDVVRSLLEQTGPLAVTSANEHGEAPCESASDVYRVFAGRVELSGVLDGGRRNATVSTVIEVSDSSWRLVRAGAVSTSAINELLQAT